jgi:hypothetical protein
LCQEKKNNLNPNTMQLHNPFQKKESATIQSFICEGGMIGKQPLRIAKTIYPPNWCGAKDSKATEVIELKNEKK